MEPDPARIPADPGSSPPHQARPGVRGHLENPSEATVLHVLRLLNRAEDEYDQPNEKGLELLEIRVECQDFWSVKAAGVDLELVVKSLVAAGLVENVENEFYSWVRQRQVKELYRITEAGKVHLLQNQPSQSRVS